MTSVSDNQGRVRNEGLKTLDFRRGLSKVTESHMKIWGGHSGRSTQKHEVAEVEGKPGPCEEE